MRAAFDNFKNFFGWKTSRKIITFCVDDYGNVRLDSREARERMNSAGLGVYSRFDAYDTLETREDLEMMFDVLTSFKDMNGNAVVLTPFVVPCNIDFEAMKQNGFQQYVRERLPDTFKKLSAISPSYQGAWQLWGEAIEKNLLAPEFHGREHFNVTVFEQMLREKDSALITSLQNRSLTSISTKGNHRIKYTAAFGFWDRSETLAFPTIVSTGLDDFEKVFGYRSIVFTPPSHQFPTFMESCLPQYGVIALDKPFYSREHLGMGKYKNSLRVTGWEQDIPLVNLVRNVVFEPTERRAGNWIASAMRQIEAAFRWNKPAIVSSHRVNFCGSVDVQNRNEGLASLRQLMQAITKKWPEIEFVSARDLVRLVQASK